jgi:hypothetical protein
MGVYRHILFLLSAADGQLISANLGDSGFMVFRDARFVQIGGDHGEGLNAESVWKLLYASKEQTHYFNCPFQLGTDSKDKVSHDHSFPASDSLRIAFRCCCCFHPFPPW